jgi:hypothetical protein
MVIAFVNLGSPYSKLTCDGAVKCERAVNKIHLLTTCLLFVLSRHHSTHTVVNLSRALHSYTIGPFCSAIKPLFKQLLFITRDNLAATLDYTQAERRVTKSTTTNWFPRRLEVQVGVCVVIYFQLPLPQCTCFKNDDKHITRPNFAIPGRCTMVTPKNDHRYPR